MVSQNTAEFFGMDASIWNYNMKILCFRCEYRARFLEKGVLKINACKSADSKSCQYYKPVIPWVFKKKKGDKRPLMLNGYSCEIIPVRLPEGCLKLSVGKAGEYLVYFALKSKNNKLENSRKKRWIR